MNADDMVIGIEFVREDKAARTRTYHIEHSGPRGKDEMDITIPMENSCFYVNASGGTGGRGGNGGNGGKGGDGGKGGRGAFGNQNQDGGK